MSSMPFAFLSLAFVALFFLAVYPLRAEGLDQKDGPEKQDD